MTFKKNKTKTVPNDRCVIRNNTNGFVRNNAGIVPNNKFVFRLFLLAADCLILNSRFDLLFPINQ